MKLKPEPQKRLSPTSINSYMGCPRCYYHKYILKMPTPPSIHLVKGRIVHKVLEDFFRRYKKDLLQNLIDNFNNSWNKSEKDLVALEMEAEDLEVHKRDAFNMVVEFYHTFFRQMKSVMELGKAENESHAYHLLKPKFRELWVEDKEIHCCGFIDRINEDYDGNITIGDYKTSQKFGLNFPTDYKRQLGIYALLYLNQEKVRADEVAVDFLRYGEVYRYEVTDEMLESSRKTIAETWEATRSTSIEDYQPNADCSFKEFCQDTEEDKKRQRELLKHLRGKKDGTT